MATERDVVERWRTLAAEHAAVVDSLERELQQRHGLTVSEFEVLQRLAEAPEEHSRMQELADSVHLSQSALSRLVGRLEADGLVCRNLCDNDRRGIFACLTPEGRSLVEQAGPTHAEVLSATLPRR
jgi:DNA-binding MarR family transcriptional regulator